MDPFDAVVTGATGLIGRWLVPELTARGRRVGVLVRDAAARAEEYRAWVTAHGGDASRIGFFESDLGAPDLGLSDADRAALRTAEDFYHLGAAMKFGLTLDHARRVNVEGTRIFFELARSAPSLRRVIHVGGYKAGGPAAGALDSATIAKLGAYEVSKIEGDALVRRLQSEGMPVTRVQPGAIIGDSRTGESTLFWGFADLVRDLFHGRLPAVVGGDGFWMPLVTVDFVAGFIARVADLGDAAESEYILLDDATPDLPELVERITRHLGLPPVRRTVPKGLLELFLRMGGERLIGVSAEALSFVGRERYDLDATRRAAKLMGLALPDIDRAIARSVDFIVASRFGAVSELGAGMRRVGGIPTFVAGDPSACEILLLDGTPRAQVDASPWDAVACEIAGTRVARADLPGFARTAKTAADPACWMGSLLAGNGDRPWIAVDSAGSRHVMAFAARHADRLGGVVLAGCAPQDEAKLRALGVSVAVVPAVEATAIAAALRPGALPLRRHPSGDEKNAAAA